MDESNGSQGGRVLVNDQMIRFDQGGLDFLRTGKRDYLYGLHCGSLYGNIRNILGVEGSATLLRRRGTVRRDHRHRRRALLPEREVRARKRRQVRFRPLLGGYLLQERALFPAVFEAKVGPHYRRITDLPARHGLDIVSLDCDGLIDALIPTWLSNGVNTMFPIEVGTWGASIAPWREQYGKELRGVGGTNKIVFARDRAAVDAEVRSLNAWSNWAGISRAPTTACPRMRSGTWSILLRADAGGMTRGDKADGWGSPKH